MHDQICLLLLVTLCTHIAPFNCCLAMRVSSALIGVVGIAFYLWGVLASEIPPLLVIGTPQNGTFVEVSLVKSKTCLQNQGLMDQPMVIVFITVPLYGPLCCVFCAFVSLRVCVCVR